MRKIKRKFTRFIYVVCVSYRRMIKDVYLISDL